MGKRVSSDEMQNIFKILQKSYDVYGPKIYQGTGCFSDTDVVRYGLLNSWEEIVWNQPVLLRDQKVSVADTICGTKRSSTVRKE